MKITKSQLDRLIRVAVLDILKELEAKAREAGLDGGEEGEAEISPNEPPIVGESAKPKRKSGLKPPKK